MTICHPSTVDWGCLSEAELADLDTPEHAAAKERALALAWTSLQTLTGYRLSICPTTVRPCSGSCWASSGMSSWITAPVDGFGQPFAPYLRGGQWFNFCGCGATCNCGPTLQRIFLPSVVGGIDSITIDDEVLPPSAYRVDNGNELIRLDGEAWPSCQDMTASGGEGTFFVSYFEGFAPNDLLNYAAGLLAWEFFLGCTGSGKCRLPSNVTSVVRQGVSIEIDKDYWTNGKSGLDEVDRIVAQINPQGLRQAPQIWSPESLAAAPRRTSWSV